MEPAKIDWCRVESIFVEEEMYEDINAPKWIDFLSAIDDPVDDRAWFCKPDCNHPITAEDFRRMSPPSKLSVSANASAMVLGSWNQRDGKLKRRAQNLSSPKSKQLENQDPNVFTPLIHRTRSSEETIKSSNDRKLQARDRENQDPNVSTPLIHRSKSFKETMKSSNDRKIQGDDEMTPTKPSRTLKSTMSASNLFGGKNILVHLSEFYSELKKTIGCREKQLDSVITNQDVTPCTKIPLNDHKKEKNPMLKPTRLRREIDEENIPVCTIISHMKIQPDASSPKIRTKPPAPQRFSPTVLPKESTPSKNSKSRFMERGILQEVKQKKKISGREELRDENRLLPAYEGRDVRSHDLFWFLKPCTQLAT